MYKLLFGILLLFACISCNIRGEKKTDEKLQSQKPNIIVMVTDDHRWDALGYADNEIIQTPHMDSLARNGAYFKNAYVTTAICAVSRASILSGQYARRHGIWDFTTPFSDSAFQQTYPMLLKEEGYYTGFIGKYGVGHLDSLLPENKFDVWHGFEKQGDYWHQDSAGNYKHLTQIMADQSIDFIQNAPENRPFNLSISFKAPHVQDGNPGKFLYDSTYHDLYRDVHIPVPKTASPEYWERLPEFFKTNNEGRIRWKGRFSTPELYQQSVKGYYRLITGVDMAIGQITEALQKQGLAGNTVIILMGDNGFFLGEHGLAGKWYGYEESIRVPLIIHDPRLTEDQKGQVIEKMALNIDLAPTILSLAGVQATGRMQGKDLTPLMKGKDAQWRQDFFYEHLLDYQTIPKSEGIVNLDLKLLQYIEQDPVFEQFFDLQKDPYEVDNKAFDTNDQEELDSMRSKLEVLRKEAR